MVLAGTVVVAMLVTISLAVVVSMTVTVGAVKLPDMVALAMRAETLVERKPLSKASSL